MVHGYECYNEGQYCLWERDYVAKKPSAKRLNVYANLSRQRKTKKDASSRKRAEYLASLPKHPVKRVLYRLHPKRAAAYWFSRRGAFMALKISAVMLLLIVVAVGGMFAYFRKDLDQIRPGELAKRVQTTVTRYYDRNDVLLWEDKGTGPSYKLVVKGNEIADSMKKATIAIEDKDFMHHRGVSFTGMMRAALNNASSESIQGGSTLTQQLVKQVFFSTEEANQRGLDGIPRKIKEVILSIEVERMYDKDQILELYLNQSSYGGRRNGVESAAETYFGKKAKDLTLAESALLAAIPNQPGLYNPYNTAGHDALIARQHKVLASMVAQGYIKQADADAAKKIAVLDKLIPEASQYDGIKAPHFVMMVRSQLETELGTAVVGKGGLVVKTTLDVRVQDKLEEQMKSMFDSYYPDTAGFSNGAGTIEDVRTGQIIGMTGSRDFSYAGFGQDNAATAFIQPGSSIKPLVYAQLFQDKGAGNLNFGSGSILSDVATDFGGGYKPQDADGKFRGNISIRQSLATSRNIPAIKAMAVNEQNVDGSTIKTIRELGDTYYCTQGAEKDAGLSLAIGGCGTRMIDHTNAIASLGRMGVYKPHASVLEVKNSSGEVLKKYKDEQKAIIDPQAAFVVNDILGDSNARRGLFGRSITPNLDTAGIKVAIKTGTSDINKQAKDIWTVGYTPSLAMTVWLGNPDTQPLKDGNSSIPAIVLDPVMTFATQLYQQAGTAKAGEWFTQPTGIQRIGSEVFPSYYDKKTSSSSVKMTFDRVSKKVATDCTPEGARIEINVIKSKDPFTKKDVYSASDGYDATKNDDTHKCTDVKPSVDGINIAANGNRITVRVSQGTFTLTTIAIQVNGTSVGNLNVSGNGEYSTPYKVPDNATVTATVSDTGFYSATATKVHND